MLAYLVNYNSSVPGLYIEAIVGIKCHILPSHMGEFFIQERHENITMLNGPIHISTMSRKLLSHINEFTNSFLG